MSRFAWADVIVSALALFIDLSVQSQIKCQTNRYFGVRYADHWGIVWVAFSRILFVE